LIGLISVTALFWLCAVSLWLLVRRFAGALQRPLPAETLWLTAGVASLLAIAIAGSLHCIVPAVRDGAPRKALASVLVLTLVLLGIAISLPASGVWGLAGFWAILSAAGCWLLTRAETAAVPGAATETLSDARRRSVQDGLRGAEPVGDEGQEFPENVDQRWIRGRDEEGREYVEGTARVAFAAGQRTAHVHLAICPPLEHPPEVEVEQVAGPPADVQLGSTLPQGIRLDVRRLESVDSENSVLVAFFGK
jgi:hypothetical protein